MLKTKHTSSLGTTSGGAATATAAAAAYSAPLERVHCTALQRCRCYALLRRGQRHLLLVVVHARTYSVQLDVPAIQQPLLRRLSDSSSS
eukprot:2640-Heterococcus_DN1.PRE.2